QSWAPSPLSSHEAIQPPTGRAVKQSRTSAGRAGSCIHPPRSRGRLIGIIAKKPIVDGVSQAKKPLLANGGTPMITRILLNYALVAAFGAARLHADSTGQTLLQALRNGDIGTVRAAIRNGANVESPDDSGNTLLMHVAVFGKPEDVEFLLAH